MNAAIELDVSGVVRAAQELRGRMRAAGFPPKSGRCPACGQRTTVLSGAEGPWLRCRCGRITYLTSAVLRRAVVRVNTWTPKWDGCPMSTDQRDRVATAWDCLFAARAEIDAQYDIRED